MIEGRKEYSITFENYITLKCPRESLFGTQLYSFIYLLSMTTSAKELSSCNREHMVYKVQIFNICSFTEKSLPPSAKADENEASYL